MVSMISKQCRVMETISKRTKCRHEKKINVYYKTPFNRSVNRLCQTCQNKEHLWKNGFLTQYDGWTRRYTLRHFNNISLFMLFFWVFFFYAINCLIGLLSDKFWFFVHLKQLCYIRVSYEPLTMRHALE